MRRIDSVEALIEELTKYVRAIAYRQASHNRLSVLLDIDDIISELQIELIHCWRHYAATVDESSLVKLAKTMVRNRMGELIYKYHGTHRKAEDGNVSLDPELVGGHNPSNPPYQIEMRDSIQRFFDALNEEEANVVCALINPEDARMILWLKVHSMRRSAAYRDPKIHVTPRIVADALHLDVAYVRDLYRSIQKKWRELNAEQ